MTSLPLLDTPRRRAKPPRHLADLTIGRAPAGAGRPGRARRSGPAQLSRHYFDRS